MYKIITICLESLKTPPEFKRPAENQIKIHGEKNQLFCVGPLRKNAFVSLSWESKKV